MAAANNARSHFFCLYMSSTTPLHTMHAPPLPPSPPPIPPYIPLFLCLCIVFFFSKIFYLSPLHSICFLFSFLFFSFSHLASYLATFDGSFGRPDPDPDPPSTIPLLRPWYEIRFRHRFCTVQRRGSVAMSQSLAKVAQYSTARHIWISTAM